MAISSSEMWDEAQQELAGALVCDAANRYIASRRERIGAFVDRHFSLAGSLALHRHAIGWDLLRAPANLFLAGPALGVKLASWAARRAGRDRLAGWLVRRRLLLETDVAREIEWLVLTELLEIPCHRRDRASYRDAIAETILADDRAAERLDASFAAPTGDDVDVRCRIAAAVESYLGSRTAVAEIATGAVAAGLGAVFVKQATPGLVTLSSALAGMDCTAIRDSRLSAGRQSRGTMVRFVSGCRRTRFARCHDGRSISRRRCALGLLRYRHRPAAAAARCAPAAAAPVTADFGG